MFTRAVGPSSEMSDPQIFPPLFNENEEFKSIVSKCKIVKTSKQVSPEQVVKDVNSISNLLSDHPMPYYQVLSKVRCLVNHLKNSQHSNTMVMLTVLLGLWMLIMKINTQQLKPNLLKSLTWQVLHLCQTQL